MEPDHEDCSAAPGWLREARRLHSLAVGWRIPGDWPPPVPGRQFEGDWKLASAGHRLGSRP